ncbi:irregular chiasm C-roughest protein-like [Branchiostoma lanceolatum]|uniref:irregular chiasm C-roughest protein-like n=1 Tax=Branchiostoma lanceolatum TaxID=7740 RepID=UPI0034512F29
MAALHVLAVAVEVSLSLVLKVQGAAYRQYPQDTATLLGQPVTLYCSFSGLSAGDVVNWHWYNPSSEAKLYHISAGSVVAPEFSRYSIVGNTQRGEYNLYIKDTSQEDEGNYRCSVFSVRDTKDIELKIIVPPPVSPEITGPRTPRTEGKGLVLTCQSRGGRPLPKLVWYNGTTRQPPVRSVSRVQHRSESVFSELVLPFLTRWDNGANISCVADQGFPKIAPPRTTFRKIHVRYAPIVHVPEPVVQAVEGAPANLTCEVDSNPKSEVLWRKFGGPLPEGAEHRGPVLTIPKVTRPDAGIFQCRADNNVKPAGFGTTTLEVLYAPSIKPSFEPEVSVLYGQEVFRQDCSADGKPQPRVRWLRHDTHRLYDNPLTLAPVTYQAEGRYVCVASSVGFPDANRETSINVIGRPDVLSDPSTTSLAGGDSIRLTCTIAADPPPDSLVWTFRGPEGEETRYRGGKNGDVTVTTVVTDRIRSVLSIDSAYAWHSGDYICKATNMFGSDQEEFRVRVKGSKWVLIAAIIVSVATGILLVTIGILCLGLRRGWLFCKKSNGTVDRPDIDPGLYTSQQVDHEISLPSSFDIRADPEKADLCQRDLMARRFKPLPPAKLPPGRFHPVPPEHHTSYVWTEAVPDYSSTERLRPTDDRRVPDQKHQPRADGAATFCRSSRRVDGISKPTIDSDRHETDWRTAHTRMSAAEDYRHRRKQIIAILSD